MQTILSVRVNASFPVRTNPTATSIDRLKKNTISRITELSVGELRKARFFLTTAQTQSQAMVFCGNSASTVAGKSTQSSSNNRRDFFSDNRNERPAA